MGIEDGGKEEQQQERIDGVGEGVIESVIEHQDDETETDGRAYPYYLHTRTAGEREDISIAIVVTGTADAHPSEREKREIDGDGDPIERCKYTFLFICSLNHKLFFFFGILRLLPPKPVTVCHLCIVPS